MVEMASGGFDESGGSGAEVAPGGVVVEVEDAPELEVPKLPDAVVEAPLLTSTL